MIFTLVSPASATRARARSTARRDSSYPADRSPDQRKSRARDDLSLKVGVDDRKRWASQAASVDDGQRDSGGF